MLLGCRTFHIALHAQEATFAAHRVLTRWTDRAVLVTIVSLVWTPPHPQTTLCTWEWVDCVHLGPSAHWAPNCQSLAWLELTPPPLEGDHVTRVPAAMCAWRVLTPHPPRATQATTALRVPSSSLSTPVPLGHTTLCLHRTTAWHV